MASVVNERQLAVPVEFNRTEAGSNLTAGYFPNCRQHFIIQCPCYREAFAPRAGVLYFERSTFDVLIECRPMLV
jgi:hypothetical protein